MCKICTANVVSNETNQKQIVYVQVIIFYATYTSAFMILSMVLCQQHIVKIWFLLIPCFSLSLFTVQSVACIHASTSRIISLRPFSHGRRAAIHVVIVLQSMIRPNLKLINKGLYTKIACTLF